MKKTKNYQFWLKKGIPAILVPGLVFASAYGLKNIDKIKNYYQDKNIFPKTGQIESYEDGDTFKLQTGQTVRLIGINAPERGEANYNQATLLLKELTQNQQIWLEYDRYQDDKYGRLLAWLWINCETKNPKFTSPDYMHLSGNASKEYLKTPPKGCKQGTLVNRKMVENNQATPVEYQNRGRLKYKL